MPEHGLSLVVFSSIRTESKIHSFTHFSPVSHFYTAWKRQKTFGQRKPVFWHILRSELKSLSKILKAYGCLSKEILFGQSAM